jgi:hypothetical protein
MAPLKLKGDRAELEVARDLVRRGYRIAIPYGEDWDFDLIFQRPGLARLERVQVKHVVAKNGVLEVRCYSQSLTNGRVRTTKLYTAMTIDWLAAFDPVSDRCYYIPADELGSGRRRITLRLAPAKNNQVAGTRPAGEYLAPKSIRRCAGGEVEPAGFEPATFRMQTERSPN